MPVTERNAEYIKRQRDRFREGRTPPDFPPNDSEIDFVNRATEAELTSIGRQMLGYDPLIGALTNGDEKSTCRADNGALCSQGSASRKLLQRCDAILGF